jgi:uncharacterized membrane protein YiaA
MRNQPSNAFIGLSWLALAVGMLSYLIGLWNAQMLLNEKGYYLAVFLFGLFAAVSVQKSVRDKLDGIPVTSLYYGLSWLATGSAVLLLVIGLWNASLALSEKGFYGIAFALSLFAAIVVQKNTRDSASAGDGAEQSPPLAEE